MNKILRSLIWKDPAEKAAATKNFGAVRKDRFLSLKQAEASVLDEILNFYSTYGEAPSYTVIHDHFEQQSLAEETLLCEDFLTEQFYDSGGLEKTVEVEVELQAAKHLKFTCTQAMKIANEGISIKGQIIKGVEEAVAFLTTSAKTPPSKGETIPASMKAANQQLLDLVQQRKNQPQNTYGILTGYGLIDTSTAGIRKKNLFVLAGFIGHLKSTLMMNMIINAAVSGWSPLLFTSEMPANDVKLLLAVIHSADMKFNGIGKPLNAFRLLLGALSQQEEEFLKLVLDDLVNNKDHGLIRVVDSGEFSSWGTIIQRTTREHQENEVDQLWVDYLTRLPVDPQYRSMSITEARNETIADAKRFAMSFDRGRGLAVCTPFQVNREGYKRAKEEEGKVDKTALAQYNAVEKEADIISYVWYDEEERLTNEPKVGMIKSRWGDVPNKNVKMFIEPDSRRIFDLGTGGLTLSNAPTSAQDAESEVTL